MTGQGDAIRIGQVWQLIDQACPNGVWPSIWDDAQRLAIYIAPGSYINRDNRTVICAYLRPNDKFLIKSDVMDRDSNRWVKIQTHEISGWIMAEVLWHRSDRVDVDG